MYFRYFVISPWKRAGPFIWKTWIPFTQGCFVPSLVEIGSVVLEKKIFYNFVNVFSLFRNYLPLEKGGALHLNKLESPSPKDALCQVWMKLAQWFWRRRWKCEKFTTTTTTTTDKFWSEKLTLAFGSGELKRTSLNIDFIKKEHHSILTSLKKNFTQYWLH